MILSNVFGAIFTHNSLISGFLANTSLEYHKSGVESIELIESYLKLSLFLPQCIHQRIVAGFSKFANEQRLVSIFLIKDFVKFDR
jgi:hypothetical protein